MRQCCRLEWLRFHPLPQSPDKICNPNSVLDRNKGVSVKAKRAPEIRTGRESLSPMTEDKKRPFPSRICIIPGVGGHPIFHRDMIVALSRNYAVSSWPHIDFNGDPATHLSDHVSYWRSRLMEFSGQDVTVIGISFGAHIANVLANERPSIATRTILVSYWPIAKPERAVLTFASTIPRTWIGRTFGPLMFRWSERNVGNLAELRNARLRLYDNPKRVQERAVSRILTLRTAPKLLDDHLQNREIDLISGESEFSLWRLRSVISRSDYFRSRLHIITGNHAIGVSPSTPLVSAISSILESTLRKE